MARVSTQIKIRRVLAIERVGERPCRSIIWYRDRNGKRQTVAVSGYVLSAECGEYTDNLIYELKDE